MRKLGLRMMALVLVLLLCTACADEAPSTTTATTENTASTTVTNILQTTEKVPTGGASTATKPTKKPSGATDTIPVFSGEAYIVLNDNIPEFTADELVTTSYETYAPLDSLGRCGAVMACVGRDIMPTEDRGSIGQVKPSGWHTVKYDFVDGKYLYNRCHLIGYQLTGENANVSNLITGTRYLNIEGMLPFENLIADYVKETNNHVLYRVTPVFKGQNLLADGVKMEALSVEDNGEGVCFNVFAYNAQPGVTIDYATGDSYATEQAITTTVSKQTTTTTKPTSTVVNTVLYILNTNTKKFHESSCGSAKKIKEENRAESHLSREELINAGYSPCKNCDP